MRSGALAVLTRTCRVACFLHPPGAVLRAAGLSSFESALFLLPLVEQRARVHSLFAAPSGTADAAGQLLFRGTVCHVRGTLARSAFHGFSIGFQRCRSVPQRRTCKSCRSLQELSKKYFVFSTSIYLQNLASIQPRTGLLKFAKS